MKWLLSTAFFYLSWMNLALAGMTFSIDYNMGSMPDNAGNVANASKITAATITDNTTLADSSSGMTINVGFERGMFGFRGKYLLEHSVEESAGLITSNGSDFASSTTNLNWSGTGFDAYLIFNKKGRLRPFVGVGYTMTTVEIEQKFVQLSGSGYTSDPLLGEGTSNGLFYYAGVDIMLAGGLGIAAQYSMFTNEVDEFTVTKTWAGTNNTPDLVAGSVMRKINAASDNWDEKYTADLSRGEIVASLFYKF